MRKSNNNPVSQCKSPRFRLSMYVVIILLTSVSVISFSLPVNAQEDTRAIGTVRIESTQPGELNVTWDAPTESPHDYRINWARADEGFPTWTDTSGNAFPTASSYTISGLDEGVRYKVRVRARYNGASGPWTGQVDFVVATAPTPTPTVSATHTPQPANTPTPTVSATHTPQPANTPTPTVSATHTPQPANTPTPTVSATHTPQPADTPTATATDTVTPADTRAIAAVRVESSQPGVIEASWDAPTESPRDYRISWARADEGFPTWTDTSGNAFPTASSYTISGLDEGVRYKVRVRARYNGASGPWTGQADFVVATAPTPTPTVSATHTPQPAYTPTPTVSATHKSQPADTPTATATNTVTPTDTASPENTPTAPSINRLRAAASVTPITETATPTATATSTPTATLTPSPTSVLTATATITATIEVESGSPDRAALVALYNSTNGSNWENNSNWITSEPLNTWIGVTSDENGRVIELNLKDNGLVGTLPTELGQLSQLKVLDLSWNRSIGGPIPSELGNLASLENLNLGVNRFSGTVPTELGSLTKLKYLNLSWNELSGSIPPELGSLSNLVQLHLYQNRLSGSIPPELGNLSKLEKLLLHYAGLSGTIPSQLSNLSNLKYLSLHKNDLSGAIPSQLGNLTNLERLYLRQNRLSGSIPSQLGNLTNLELLHLSRNEFTGSMPSTFSNITGLKWVRLVGNRIMSGCIPTIWRSIPVGGHDADFNDLHILGLPFCDTPEASATPAPSVTISGGSGTSSDPYIIADPLSVTSQSIRSYFFNWNLDHSVYFQWDVGSHTGEWGISIDRNPISGFGLSGRDDDGDEWDDTDTSWSNADPNIAISAQSDSNIYIQVVRGVNNPPIGLTLTISPPAATATPTATATIGLETTSGQ